MKATKELTLTEALKKLQRAVGRKEFCTLCIDIKDHRNGDGPRITYVGYVADIGITAEHPNLKGVIKELRDRRKPVDNGDDIKLT